MDFELILVNDGSSDMSADICNSYAALDARVKVIHKPNGGVSSARNLGIDKASGKWLCFADSDDIVKPGAFKALMDCAPADLVVSEFDYITVSGHCIFEQVAGDGRYFGADILDAVAQWPWMYWATPCNKLFSAEIIRANKLRFNTHITIEEDLVFNFQYLLHVQSMVTTAIVTYSYCENVGSSVHRKHSFDSYSNRNYVLNQAIESIIGKKSKRLIKLKYLNHYFAIVPSMYGSNIDRNIRFGTLTQLKYQISEIGFFDGFKHIPGGLNKLIILMLFLFPIRITDRLLGPYFRNLNPL